mgnify:CR=1 FL=1
MYRSQVALTSREKSTATTSAAVAEFMEHVLARNPGQVEFHQGVQ